MGSSWEMFTLLASATGRMLLVTIREIWNIIITIIVRKLAVLLNSTCCCKPHPSPPQYSHTLYRSQHHSWLSAVDIFPGTRALLSLSWQASYLVSGEEEGILLPVRELAERTWPGGGPGGWTHGSVAGVTVTAHQGVLLWVQSDNTEISSWILTTHSYT